MPAELDEATPLNKNKCSEELTAVVRSRQLHIYRNGKKVLVLAGKAAPKVIRDDKLCVMLNDDGQ